MRIFRVNAGRRRERSEKGKTMTSRPRLSIRAVVEYRGKAGFTLSGTVPESTYSVRIFVRKRETAEKIRDIYKNEPRGSDRWDSIDKLIREEVMPK